MHYSEKNLPFGGVGESGMGAYHGKEGEIDSRLKWTVQILVDEIKRRRETLRVRVKPGVHLHEVNGLLFYLTRYFYSDHLFSVV